MARSRNKHSRAALRAKSRRPKRHGSSAWFTWTLVVVCLVGVAGVVLASGVLSRDEAAASPTTTDHWHSAFAVNVCGEWLTSPPEFEQAADNPNIVPGIHTHGDGFIHIHPHTRVESGDNATLGRYFDYGGWSVSSKSLDVWSGPSFDAAKTEWSNGDRCPNAAGEAGAGARGRVVFEVNCKSVSGDPSDFRLGDQQVVAIGFLPRGEEMGAPPNAASAPDQDIEGDVPEAINQKGCRPSAENNPGVAPTTPTTAPASTSTTGQ